MVRESQGEECPFHLCQGRSRNIRESQGNLLGSRESSTFAM